MKIISRNFLQRMKMKKKTQFPDADAFDTNPKFYLTETRVKMTHKWNRKWFHEKNYVFWFHEIFLFFRDDSSSGDEDLDDEGIQRRRELMRQKALARAQIGMGQEEVMAKEDEKSASEGKLTVNWR